MTPIDTMMPVTPARVSASPLVRESSEMTLKRIAPVTQSPASTTKASDR